MKEQNYHKRVNRLNARHKFLVAKIKDLNEELEEFLESGQLKQMSYDEKKLRQDIMLGRLLRFRMQYGSLLCLYYRFYVDTGSVANQKDTRRLIKETTQDIIRIQDRLGI